MFSDEVIAQAESTKPGYYAGEEFYAESAAYVAAWDRQTAEDWKAYIAWHQAHPTA